MNKKRVVIKIGSSSLAHDNGELSDEKVKAHTSAIVHLYKQGHEVILVSSGAVAAGFPQLGYPTKPVTLVGKQAAAAVGQGCLIEAYREQLEKHDIHTGQILLTQSNFSHKHQYQNAYATISELLKRKVIPIINENDSIAIEELTFGDNDMLSALVSGFIHADQLVIITDINGIYDANPFEDPNAKRYDEITDLDDKLLQQAGSSGSRVGTGGMRSKLLAAKTAMQLGVDVFIGASGKQHYLTDILEGNGDGTYLYKYQEAVQSKIQWLGLHSKSDGEITIDKGAVEALLENGKSLLPSGVIDVTGSFTQGAVITVKDEEDEELGKGISNMSSNELLKVKGMSSSEASKYIVTKREEVIHRDEWTQLTSIRG
ncbi:glutamate 5-kinase [Texcoconibacillus texcoconensis]|uniref:Glutamate 5-kinase n=1 Tax=Texcoconibacillus texcoconensis TaxID=1095777 RepID=A0A840QSU0_9BACI|nr:glutamate 5-kinase [Texcoconibacillus texcoconensis]MBB5174434.1 glutamate 5-kinase [Texcoconibacillus texcoconensis]